MHNKPPIFKNPFWNYDGTGNPLHGYFGMDKYLYWTIIAFAFIAYFLIWVFRRTIHDHFKTSDDGTKKIQRYYLIFVSLILLFMQILRTIWVVDKSYGRIWEAIPLQFCRLILILITGLIIFNKIEYIPYITPFSTVAASIALIIREMPKSVGIDSYLFWDFLLIHLFILIFPMVISSIKQIRFTIYDSIFRISFIVFFASIGFIINIVTLKFAPKEWRSNFFFIAPNESNGLPLFKNKPSLWPLTSLVYLSFCLFWETLSDITYCLQDKIYINKIDNFWIFKIKKSDNFRKFFNIKHWRFYKPKKALINYSNKEDLDNENIDFELDNQ